MLSTRLLHPGMALVLVAGAVGLAAGCGDEESERERKMAEPSDWRPWLTSFHGGGRDDGPRGDVNECVGEQDASSTTASSSATTTATADPLQCDGTGFHGEKLRVSDGKSLGNDGERPVRRSEFGRTGGLAFTSSMKDPDEKPHEERGALGGERTVKALDATSGKERWTHDVRESAVLHKGTVIGDEVTKVTNRPDDGDYEDWTPNFKPGGDLIAWDARTGKERWRLKTPGKQWCSPTKVADRPFLTCADSKTGKPKVTWYAWSAPADGGKRGDKGSDAKSGPPRLREIYSHQQRDQGQELEPVGMDGGNLVFLPPKGSDFPPQAEFGELVRVDARTGTQQRRKLPASIGKGATPHLVGGELYFARDRDGHGTRLVAVGAADGRERWKSGIALEYASEPNVSTRRDEIYFADPAGRLVALDRDDGRKLWQTRARAQDGGTEPGEMDPRSSVTRVKDVLVVSTGNTVFSVSPQDPDAAPRETHRVDLKNPGQKNSGRKDKGAD